MTRLECQPVQRRESQTQRIRSPSSAPGAAGRALEHPELVTQGEILEGDGRRAEEQGAEERPETDHEQHRNTLTIRDEI
jgi:hypothetical protein